MSLREGNVDRGYAKNIMNRQHFMNLHEPITVRKIKEVAIGAREWINDFHIEERCSKTCQRARREQRQMQKFE